jgi:pyruvate kinase
MVEIRGRSPAITSFEHGVDSYFIERGDDMDVRVDTTGKAISTKTKIYLSTAGLERVVRAGDTFYFETGLKCFVVDVNEAFF